MQGNKYSLTSIPQFQGNSYEFLNKSKLITQKKVKGSESQSRFMSRKTNSMDLRVQEQDFLDWPIEKIVEQYTKNPFFKHKIMALAHRKQYIGNRLSQSKLTTQGSNPEIGIFDSMVVVRSKTNELLKKEFNKLTEILEAINKISKTEK